MCTGCTGDEINLGDLEEFPENELSATVTIDERCGDPFLGEFLDGLGDVRSLDSDGILDSGLKEVEHIGPSLHDDDGLGVLHVGSGRTPVLSVGGDLLDLDTLPDAVHEVGTGTLGLLDELVEELLRTLHDLLPLGHTDILYSEDVDGGLARSDTVDCLESGSEDYGLHLVETGRHVDYSVRFSTFGCDLDLYPSDPTRFLEVPEVQLVSEETLGLTENSTNDIRLLNDSVCVDSCFNHVFCCIGIDVQSVPS